MDDVAGHRRLAVRQQIALGVGALLQLLELVLPVEGDAGGDDIALFRGLDRGLQQGIEPELAVIAQDGRPGIDRAGNGDGMRRGQRDRMDLALEIPVGRRGLRRPAGAVIGHDLALALGLDQREAIAADAGGLRLDHAEQRAGRHRGVRGGAAGTQHLDRRSAPPADARSPPSRSGRGPWTGRRDGNSSCQIAHFVVVSRVRPDARGTRSYMAYSCGAGQWPGVHTSCVVPAIAGILQGFPLARPA